VDEIHMWSEKTIIRLTDQLVVTTVGSIPLYRQGIDQALTNVSPSAYVS